MSPKISDDPRLTAYALGELNATDRAAVEQQIGDSVETLLEIEAIREVAGQLRAALREEHPESTHAPSPTAATPTSTVLLSHSHPLSHSQPARQSASRVAVAASCLALLGTFTWVGWNGRSSLHDRTIAMRFGEHQPSRLTDLDLKTWGTQVALEGLAEKEERELAARSFALGASPEPKLKGMIVMDGYDTKLPEVTKLMAATRGEQLSRGRPTVTWMAPQSRAQTLFGRKTVQLDDLSELTKETPQNRSLREPLVAESEDQLALGFRFLRRKESVDGETAESNFSAEDYAKLHDNPFASPLAEPLSTFSIDVDTAAYSNMRRFLTQGSWPPVDSVRIEELVNYFSYDYAPPEEETRNSKSEKRKAETVDQPFAVHLEVAGCPWNAEHRLVRVGLKGKEIALDKRPVSNIVFLIDVSGSMNEPNKLPLVKAGLKRLVDQFTENDRVGIVVYAGASGLVLDSTNASQKDVILSSIENLQAGGSTNGGEGIQLAYALARKHFIEKGTNRVILCTDGDFNVGITNQDDLTRLIEEESKSGVFLSVLGFGMGNLKDSTLEKLADKGNGNYAYIDTLREANKVFVEQMTGTLITIAKDVKIQIEFNPTLVGAYRLIGYENRMLAAQDFHDDTKDAGEIGAGHTVTALYEIIPPSKLPAQPKEPVVEETLKYQPNVKSPAGQGLGVRGQGLEKTQPQPSAVNPQPSANSELLTIKLRYKQPDADKSSLIEQPLTDAGKSFAQASTDFRFAASVASFGMILRHSPHRGNATLDSVAEIAQSSLGTDKSGYRSEFVSLVRSAKSLKPAK